MGNTNTSGKGHIDHRTFSPELSQAGVSTTRELSSSRPSDQGSYEGHKNKLLLSQHSTDYSNDADDEFRVSLFIRTELFVTKTFFSSLLGKS
jgi:hypothetical protein